MQKRKRLQNKVDFLFLGLWNPDPVYEHTRHNVGMNVVSLLVQKLNSQFSLSEEGTYEKVLIDYENKKLLIGLSGGMDSVVLLDLCEKIIPSGKLFAIHINHGLTKESDNHEKFVYKICIDKNIPLILKAEKRTIKRNQRQS